MTEDLQLDPVATPAALFAGAVAALLSLCACDPGNDRGAATAPPPVEVRLLTDYGTIDLEIDQARAPITAANFLRYVDAGHYEGGIFHRTVRLDNQPDNDILIEVVQGGVAPERTAGDFDPIPLERTKRTGLQHTDGAVSMARDGPDTATSDFFICVGDQPELDFGGRRNPDGHGFAAFGRVIRGMEVVRAIQEAPADGQSLNPPVIIRHASRPR
jgi:peptidyl-prolyl cis-trans isomerase A (cyclophilin A)